MSETEPKRFSPAFELLREFINSTAEGGARERGIIKEKKERGEEQVERP